MKAMKRNCCCRFFHDRKCFLFSQSLMYSPESTWTTAPRHHQYETEIHAVWDREWKERSKHNSNSFNFHVQHIFIMHVQCMCATCNTQNCWILIIGVLAFLAYSILKLSLFDSMIALYDLLSVTHSNNLSFSALL